MEESTNENGSLIAELQQQNGNLQQKVQELTKENEQQKQDFEERIAQLQQEKEEILNQLPKKLAEEEDKQIDEQPIHEMKVQLPLENWYDFLALVPRCQLGNIASEIGDRQFACILQSFLHEHRDITLGSMEIIQPRPNVPSDRSMLRAEVGGAAVDLPDWPIPRNVKNFDGISFQSLYKSVYLFLRKFQENSLLANVKLDCGYKATRFYPMLPIMNTILPLISGIDSLHFDNLFDWVDKDDEEIQLLLETMVAQTRILSIQWYTNAVDQWDDATHLVARTNWCCSWLYTPRDDGMPRTLILECRFDDFDCSSFINRIKKDFVEANHSVSFFIRLTGHIQIQQEISLNNNKTNEKLVGKAGVSDRHGRETLLITRHSSKAAKHKIEEDEKEISEWNKDRGPKRIKLN